MVKKEKGVGVVKNANAPKQTLKQKKKAVAEALAQKSIKPNQKVKDSIPTVIKK